MHPSATASRHSRRSESKNGPHRSTHQHTPTTIFVVALDATCVISLALEGDGSSAPSGAVCLSVDEAQTHMRRTVTALTISLSLLVAINFVYVIYRIHRRMFVRRRLNAGFEDRSSSRVQPYKWFSSQHAEPKRGPLPGRSEAMEVPVRDGTSTLPMTQRGDMASMAENDPFDDSERVSITSSLPSYRS